MGLALRVFRAQALGFRDQSLGIRADTFLGFRVSEPPNNNNPNCTNNKDRQPKDSLDFGVRVARSGA